MTKSSRSRKSGSAKWYENQTLLIAILGVAGTIIAALISVSPTIIQSLQKPEPTQTAIPSTATLEMTPTLMPTSTETSIPFTETISTTPTETGTPTPITPPTGCLDRWQIIASNTDLAEIRSAGNCTFASAPDLGISASSTGISFGINAFREQGTFGIATSLPTEATISLSVNLTVLTQGEFWIALSNEPNPENNMAIIALQSQFGEVKIYNNQTDTFVERYLWDELTSNTTLGNGPPYLYNITFNTNGNKVTQQIHFTNLPSQFVNLPNYLFIGYNKKSSLGSVTMQVEVTNISIDVK